MNFIYKHCINILFCKTVNDSNVIVKFTYAHIQVHEI